MEQPKPSSELFKKLGLENLDPVQQERIMGMVAELIQSKLSNRVAAFLSDQDMGQIEAYMANNDSDKIDALVRERIPGYDELVRTVSDETIDELAAQKAEVMQALKST